MNYLNELINHVEQNRSKNLSTVAIVTDISKAFDTVKTEILIEKFNGYNIGPRYLRWIRDFLTDRSYTFVHSSGKYTIVTDDGFPQGSVLSPSLFNIYTRDIHNLETENVKILQYADDITLLISSDTANNLERLVRCTMTRFIDTLNDLKLSVNIEKTQKKKTQYD